MVDTAADVTILSEKLFAKMAHTAKIKATVNLLAAGEGQKFKAKQLEPVKISIGKNTIHKSIFVAPIHDDMLLGMDILRELKATIDLDKNTLTSREDTVPLFQATDRPRKKGVNTKRRVTLSNGLSIPALTEVTILVDIQNPPTTKYLWIDSSQNLPVLVASAVFQTSESPFLNIMNNSNSSVTLPKGTILGNLHPLNDFEIIDSEKEEADNDTLQVRRCQLVSNPEELPERLQPLLDNVSDKLTASDVTELRKTLIEFQDVFAESEFDLGNFTAIHHHIDTGDARPIKLPLRKTPLHFLDEEENLLNKMLKAKVIQPSTSSWAAAPVLVRKKEGSLRWCIDYRLCNKVTKPDVYPMPLMSDCIDALDGNIWFSKLDANSAYWQIPLDPESKEKTAFRTRQGLFEFNKLPFGLSNAPSTFCRAMNLVLEGMNWRTVLSFLDDICVLGKSASDHIKNLREVFERFRSFGLKLKPKKCLLFREEIEFLGRLVNSQGMALTDHSIEVIKGWAQPESAKDVQRFLGLANYHRNFIKNFSHKAEPLSRLLRKDNEFEWGEEQIQAFNQLKEELISKNVLAIPTRTGEFILDTDASDKAIGAELLQVQNGEERVIAYGSYTLSSAQQRYCTTRKELLAVVRFTNHFRHYLLGKKFTVRTDHSSLTWLMNFRNVEGQLARWLEELQRFNMDIQHRPGKDHGNADALSRRPEGQSCTNSINSLPCGGCHYCQRIERKWRNFENNVNDVVELSSNFKARDTNYASVRPVTGPIIDSTSDDNNDDSPWDDDLVRTAQQQDDDLEFLRNWLSDDSEPDYASLNLAGQNKKFYWSNRDRFKMSDGIIYHMGKEDDQLVIPESLKGDILKLCHDIPSSGHQGIARTKERIKRNYFWYKLNKDVVNHIAKCQPCALSKTSNRKAKYPMVQNHAGIPMEKVHIDFLGPLPKSKKGNEHILVMVDNFTKWIECIPLHSQTAEVTARSAVNDFFSRFGYPLKLVSDQGRNFESSLFKEVCRVLQINKSRTTAYRPSANGQAERMNRTLMSAVRCFVDECKDEWDEYIPLITSAIRSSVNRNTGFTPNHLMLGRELNTPAEMLLPDPLGQPKSSDVFARDLEEKMQLSYKIAREKLKGELKRAKTHYDIHKRESTFKKGDVVYCMDHAPTNKLHPKWIGPCVITWVRSPFLFRIQFKNREWTVNHDSLKLCLSDNLPVWVQKLREKIAKDSLETYCICGKPDDGLLMIQCYSCLDWFHGKCVKLTKAQADRINYLCNYCLK